VTPRMFAQEVGRLFNTKFPNSSLKTVTIVVSSVAKLPATKTIDVSFKQFRKITNAKSNIEIILSSASATWNGVADRLKHAYLATRDAEEYQFLTKCNDLAYAFKFGEIDLNFGWKEEDALIENDDGFLCIPSKAVKCKRNYKKNTPDFKGFKHCKYCWRIVPIFTGTKVAICDYHKDRLNYKKWNRLMSLSRCQFDKYIVLIGEGGGYNNLSNTLLWHLIRVRCRLKEVFKELMEEDQKVLDAMRSVLYGFERKNLDRIPKYRVDYEMLWQSLPKIEQYILSNNKKLDDNFSIIAALDDCSNDPTHSKEVFEKRKLLHEIYARDMRLFSVELELAEAWLSLEVDHGNKHGGRRPGAGRPRKG